MTQKTIVRTVALAILVTSAAGVLPARSSVNRKGTVFDAVLTPYEAIHKALAADSLKGVARNARAIRDTARTAAASFEPTRAGVTADKGAQCQALLPKVAAAAGRLAEATTLAEARDAFGKLSRPMVQWREMFRGTNKPKVVFCPMVKKPWLQESNQVANPYLGKKMLRCGKIVSN
ncbi:MAG: DUF3347 domain-containing protein [Acidobacteria bacterium]|nr:DUF3347 domain-containing protein [Acidobacteriota bacterium]